MTEGHREDTEYQALWNTIPVTELNLNIDGKGIVEEEIRIPHTWRKKKNMENLITIFSERTDGAFARESIAMMKMARKMVVSNCEDAMDVGELVKRLDDVTEMAKKGETLNGEQLSVGATKYRTRAISEIRWYLLLQALNSLKLKNKDMLISDKEEILGILGFEKDYERIDEFREGCLIKGYGYGYGNQNVKELEKWCETFLSDRKNYKNFTINFSPASISLFILWASSFLYDSPVIREIFCKEYVQQKISKILPERHRQRIISKISESSPM